MIDAIYEAGLDPARWPIVIKAVADELGGVGGALHFADLTGAGFSFGISHEVDPQMLTDYSGYYYAINPLHRGLMLRKANTVVADHELVSRHEMDGTEVYNDLFKKFGVQGSATAVLAKDLKQHSSFAIIGNGMVYERQQLDTLAALLPHLARALVMNRKLELLSVQRDVLTQTLDLLAAPVILIDANGLLMRANSAAEQILRLRDGLDTRNRRLVTEKADESATLRKLILTAIHAPRSGGDMVVSRPSGRSHYFLSVCPIEAGSNLSASAVVIVNNPDAFEPDGMDLLMRTFHVTPAEAKVVMAIVRGDDLAQFADASGVSPVTARNQLTRAMAKLGVYRQAELVRLVLGTRSPKLEN